MEIFFFFFRPNTSESAANSMSTKLSNILKLLFDIGVLLFHWIYITIESIVRLAIPEQETDVQNDIVLVCLFYLY